MSFFLEHCLREISRRFVYLYFYGLENYPQERVLLQWSFRKLYLHGQKLICDNYVIIYYSCLWNRGSSIAYILSYQCSDTSVQRPVFIYQFSDPGVQIPVMNLYCLHPHRSSHRAALTNRPIGPAPLRAARFVIKIIITSYKECREKGDINCWRGGGGSDRA